VQVIQQRKNGIQSRKALCFCADSNEKSSRADLKREEEKKGLKEKKEMAVRAGGGKRKKLKSHLYIHLNQRPP